MRRHAGRSIEDNSATMADIKEHSNVLAKIDKLKDEQDEAYAHAPCAPNAGTRARAIQCHTAAPAGCRARLANRSSTRW